MNCRMPSSARNLTVPGATRTRTPAALVRTAAGASRASRFHAAGRPRHRLETSWSWVSVQVLPNWVAVAPVRMLAIPSTSRLVLTIWSSRAVVRGERIAGGGSASPADSVVSGAGSRSASTAAYSRWLEGVGASHGASSTAPNREASTPRSPAKVRGAVTRTERSRPGDSFISVRVSARNCWTVLAPEGASEVAASRALSWSSEASSGSPSLVLRAASPV